MSRNYGIGSRDMHRAAKMILDAAAIRGNDSFGTARTVSDRFRRVVEYAKQHGVNRMERITWEVIVQYGQELAWEVEEGIKSASYAQNLVSAANTVMAIATRGSWQSVSPTRDCGISKRCAVRKEPLPSPELAEQAIQSISDSGYERAACIAQLALALGLRCLEASLINCCKALDEANHRGEVTIVRGTKGGLERHVPIRSQNQVEVLAQAANIQGKDKCLIPADSNWIRFKRREILKGREILNSHGIGGYRELRSLYAAGRYTEITGHLAPCNSASRADKEVDLAARKEIAGELGHGRPQILNSYIGGRK